MPTVAAVAIGSNLGDRRAHIAFACERLARLFDRCRASTIVETDPIGVPGPQPRFLNAAVVGETDLSAPALLDALMSIEREAGRTRTSPGDARTLDLDLVLLGDQIMNAPGLVVPHPRFRERRFVLEPLAEIAPELRDPVTGRTVAELLREQP